MKTTIALARIAVASTLIGASLHAQAAKSPGKPSAAPPIAQAMKPVAFTPLPGANVITVVANDFAFDMPASIPAGLTTMRLSNKGKEIHHVFVVKVDKGKKPDDVVAWFKSGGPPPKWLRPVGGPNAPAPMPGAEAIFTSTLAAGDYVALCVIPSADGVPHVMKGMVKAFTVTPSTRTAPTPIADITLTLTDYDFAFSKPLTAGKHVIAVKNAGKQGHEYFMGKLLPGKTPMELAIFAEKKIGAPPGIPMGGITDILPGDVVYVQVDLPAGEYAFICFSPDAKDGKPHLTHGMIKQVSVK